MRVYVYIKNDMLATLQFDDYLFPIVTYPILGNEKHSLQQYNKTMFIKTEYVGNGFLLPHYTTHLTKIQNSPCVHLILLLVPSCSPFIIELPHL